MTDEFFFDESSLDLESNLKSLSIDLCRLVDHSVKDNDAFLYDADKSGSFDFIQPNELNSNNESVDLNTILHSVDNSIDSSDVHTSPGPTYYDPSFNDFFTDSKVDEVGFLSGSSDFHDSPSSSHHDPLTVEDQNECFFDTNFTPDTTMHYVSQQLLTPTILPSFIGAWHPWYGNMFMTAPTPISNPLGVPIIMPVVQSFPTLPNSQEFTYKPQKRMPTKSANQQNRGFNKKYPRRSQKGFDILPKHNQNDKTTDLDDVVIDLRELNIGPASLYETAQTKLMNNFIEALDCLSCLSNECVQIEYLLFKGSSKTENPPIRDFVKDLTGYQFSYYLQCIVNYSRLEQINSRVVLKRFEPFFSDNITELGNALLSDLHQKTESLSQLISLHIIRDIVFDVNERPDELKCVREALEKFIGVVVMLLNLLWSLKVLYNGTKTEIILHK